MAKIKDLDDLDSQETTEEETKFINAADMNRGNITKKNKGGRPRKSAEEKASEQIFINVTPNEKLKIEEHAKQIGVSVSALCKIGLSQMGKL